MTDLKTHLREGVTTVARCWSVLRRDGEQFGFTDHDLPLEFGGQRFRADTGMTARAIASATGLSVDNSEAMGALSDDAITEADIEAGRFDGAEVRAWLVNWSDVAQRRLVFRGSIGELRRVGGAFHAELRGLTEALNQPQGRVYQRFCTAIPGSAAFGFDMDTDGYSAEIAVEEIVQQRRFLFGDFRDFEPGWFERGRLEVLSGAAAGLVAVVKRDRFASRKREIEIWEALRAPIEPGDRIRIEAGYDGRLETARLKFDNLVNYRGFPDIPGEDWMITAPVTSGQMGGGSRRGG